MSVSEQITTVWAGPMVAVRRYEKAGFIPKKPGGWRTGRLMIMFWLRRFSGGRFRLADALSQQGKPILLIAAQIIPTSLFAIVFFE
ncbi:hypothetical protein [Methylomagnum sp.]